MRAPTKFIHRDHPETEFSIARYDPDSVPDIVGRNWLLVAAPAIWWSDADGVHVWPNPPDWVELIYETVN